MSTQTVGILPHGGQLINRIVTSAERDEFLDQKEHLPRVQLDDQVFERRMLS